MKYDVLPLTRLIEHFERLPGIGKKSAQRLAFYVLGLPEGMPYPKRTWVNCQTKSNRK